MKRLLTLVVLLQVFGDRGWADDRQQAAAALTLLKSWQSSHARPTERYLQIVCWTPSDREFPDGHRDRLSRMLLHIQNFYAEQMASNGFERHSFKLKLNEDGRVVMHEVRGSHPTSHYAKRSGDEIRQECLPALRQLGIVADQETMAIFCNLATWDEKGLRFSHNSPYYAGGTYRSGIAWQLDSRELDALNLPRKAPMMHDGEYGRISLGKHNSIFIGGMAHEIGHAFGLPHCEARPDERSRGTALMGAGNRTYGDEIRGEGRGTFLTFAHALRLASHPLFCGYLEKGTNPPKSTLSDLTIRADGRAIVVGGAVAGDPSLYGVVAYFDPAGHDDYNQASAAAVPNHDGHFELRCDALVPGKGVLKLVPLHANGAAGDQASAWTSYAYQVAENGTPNLESIHARLSLEPIVQALRRGDASLARRLAGDVRDKAASAVAARLTDPAEPTETPAAYDGPSRSRSLTAFKADDVSVGWASPTFNRIPDDSMLLESGGEIFATGIYAHAPARHVYALGGRWETLKGQVGIATGHNGSVRFAVRGDGRELWRSATVRSDQIVSFEVSIAGIERLELITSPTEDGTSNDWGLWLEPQLLRSR